ncbi:MAG: flotillin family protein, partial [Polyangiaceae bacterium]
MIALDGGVVFLVGLVVFGLLVLLSGFRVIPNDRVGIVEKRFSEKGSIKTGLIALHGEAGFQPQVLRGGIHFRTPFQYQIHTMPLVTIPQGKIGYVFARDGETLGATQALASNVKARDFQDVEDFLRNGGQRGPQRQILREGTHAINLAQFVVVTEGQVFYLPLNDSEDATFKQMAYTIQDRDG